MAFGIGPDEERQQDEVLSKVDALLRRHRDGGLDAMLDEGAEIPTLTELLEEPSPTTHDEKAEAAAGREEDPVDSGVQTPADHPDVEQEKVKGAPDEGREDSPASSPVIEDEIIERLRAEIDRAVSEAVAKQLPKAIQEEAMPEIMLHLGEGLNRLRDAMSNTVRSVVQETITQEVKRTLKAMLKEREQR